MQSTGLPLRCFVCGLTLRYHKQTNSVPAGNCGVIFTMANFKVRHYASKAIELAHESDYSMLIVELFIAVLSIAFVIAGYIQEQQFLVFTFIFPALFSIIAALVTFSFMLVERFVKKRNDD